MTEYRDGRPYTPTALELAEDDLACALSLRQHADSPEKREVAARIVARCRLALAEARSEDSDTGPDVVGTDVPPAFSSVGAGRGNGASPPALALAGSPASPLEREGSTPTDRRSAA